MAGESRACQGEALKCSGVRQFVGMAMYEPILVIHTCAIILGFSDLEGCRTVGQWSGLEYMQEVQDLLLIFNPQTFGVVLLIFD